MVNLTILPKQDQDFDRVRLYPYIVHTYIHQKNRVINDKMVNLTILPKQDQDFERRGD